MHSACKQLERPRLELHPHTVSLLRLHRWPGNVRELKNVMERAVVLCAESSIGPEYLPASFTQPSDGAEAIQASPTLIADIDPKRFDAQIDSLRRARIVEALSRCGGNQTQAAELLGIARRTLVAQLVELGIPRPRTRNSLR